MKRQKELGEVEVQKSHVRSWWVQDGGETEIVGEMRKM